MTAGAKSRPQDIRRSRRRRQHGCWDHLIVAPLWVAYQANLGTLLRTCDAVGACMAVPDTGHYRTALARGDTLRRRPHIHWLVRSKLAWIREERTRGSTVLAVELADDAIALAGSLMVQIAVPGERWEVEFMVDGSVEVERFRSDGTIGDRSMLADLWVATDD